MDRALSDGPLTAGDRDRSQVSPCEMCGEQGGNRTGCSPSSSVFTCQYHSTNAPYSVIYMLLFPDGQMNESWEPSNNRSAMDRGAVSMFRESHKCTYISGQTSSCTSVDFLHKGGEKPYRALGRDKATNNGDSIFVRGVGGGLRNPKK